MRDLLKVAITGSRNWTDKKIIKDALEKINKRVLSNKYILMHGGTTGADIIGSELAKELGWSVRVFETELNKYENVAEQIINDEPHILLAFPLPESNETCVTIDLAKKYNKEYKKQINSERRHKINIVVHDHYIKLKNKVNFLKGIVKHA